MFNLFKKTTITRVMFFVAADIFFIALSVWLAFLLRFDGSIPEQYYPFIIRMIILAVIFLIPVFYFEKLYSFSWSYVSTNEIISLFRATAVAFVFLTIAIFVSHYFPHFINFPRSTIIISFILVFTFCGALRISKRLYLNMTRLRRINEKERTLIVGAGDAGEQILRNILSLHASPYSLVGFVDDNPIKRGVKIHGLNVLGKISDIPNLVQSHNIKQLIIALPSANNSTIRMAVELGKSAGLRKIKIAPPLIEIIKGEISLKNLKDVGVEDLLGRDPVSLDKKQIEDFIKNNTVLITGAAGSIGSELCLQVAKFKPSLMVLLDQDETGIFNILETLKNKFDDLVIKPLVADIQDKEKIQSLFTAYKPQIVFHAAAYKHVPLMEAQPDEAIKNNILGTNILLDACLQNNVKKFIFISTDKAVNPTSVMGSTKRMGEMLCRAYNSRSQDQASFADGGQKNSTKFISVRFGNVLNSRGSVIPIFKEQIKRGGPVEVTHPEMKRYFMLTSEACLLVMQAGAMGQGGEVFVLDMGKPIKILDLAKEMIRLSGFEPNKDIAIVFTGIRPGEKLFEEMLTAQEGITSTRNQKIFMAKMPEVDFSSITKKMDDLENMIYKDSTPAIIEALKNIIAEP